MRKDIHPEYNKDFKITCSTCQSIHEFGSTSKGTSVDVCSNCHPVYTGERNFARATGRVQRFQRLLKKQGDKR